MEAKPLKIYKVKDLEDTTKYPPLNPILPQPPFLLVGYGSVRSGKTNSLINMMRRKDMYGTEYWDDVLVISNTAKNDPKMYKFMGDAFRVEDHYDNNMITDLIAQQKSYDRADTPTQLLILDDIISKEFSKGTGRKNGNAINSLATRFRHYEMSIMIFVQSARAVSNMIRSNATDILIYRQQSNLEMDKLREEYSDLAPKNFELYYKIAMMEDYNFLYIDGQKNPSHFYAGFSELLGIGDKMVYKGEMPKDDSDDEVFE
tara:strand:- start:637 stop:1413 length:777 start_codon:yes stop_codon:yes gene_type:complete